MPGKTIAFFPEAAFGPALNSVGIAQAVEALGHKAVFLSDPGFVAVYEGYGFEAHPVNLSAPMPPEQMAKFWEDFINGHIPNFRKSPYDQIDNYVKDCWTAIVDTAKWAQKDLPGVLAQGEAGHGLRRQRDPLSGDQAVRQAVGQDHLLLGERDRGRRYSAASFRLRRERQGLPRRLSQALQRGDRPDPRRLQRVPPGESARRLTRSASSSKRRLS